MSEGLRILVVEGNPADASFIHEMLPQAGPLQFQVESARKLSEALARLERRDIDLVLLNLVLPDSQGLQTLHTLQKAAPEIPVIVLAGTEDHELAVAAVRDGAQDYLVKGQVSARPLLHAARYALARQKAAAAARQSELKFRTLVESIPHKIFIKDGGYRYFSVNENFARDLHIRPEDAVGKTDYDFFPKEMADKFRADDRRIMREGRTEEFDEKYLLDGREVWVHTAKSPVRDEDGKVTGVLGIFWDITERKRMEEALNYERDLLRTLLDNSPDNIYFKDAQSRFIKASKAQARQFGVASPDEVAGKTDFDFFDEAHARPAFEDEQEIIRTGRPMIAKEEREVWKDGRVTWASSTKIPLLDGAGKIIGIIGISRDITEHKRAEMALLESQALYQSLVTQMPAGLFRKDREGRFVMVNPMFCRLKGLSAEEILGKTPKELDDYERAREAAGLLKPPRQRPLAAQGADHHERIIRTGETIEVEEVYPQPDGTVEYFHAVKTPVFDAEGGVIGSQGMQFDITERRRAEEALRRMSSAVEHSPASIVITDRAGNIEYVNPKFTAVTGYSPEEAIGKNPRILKSGETPAAEYQRLWQTITSGKEWRGEFHNRKKNGELFWESVSISAIFDDSGEVAHFVAVKEDITEFKLAREKLRERESFLSAITENQPGLLWLKDAEGRFLMVNKAFAAACGRKDPELVRGLTDLDVWPKDLVEKYRADDQRVMSAGNAIVVEEMIVIGDKRFWHETFKTAVRDDQDRVIGTTGYARDITGRKLAEQQVKEALDFNRAIISDAAVGITVFKASGQCVLANETAARTVKATVSQLLAQDFRQIASWHASGMVQIAEEVLATKEPRRCELHFFSSFGAEVWIESRFSHFIQNGEPHFIHVFADVTEKKKLEAQLLRSQRMESIGTLAGGIAHDLNNVLAPLLISVQVLKEKVSDDDGRSLLDSLEANVKRGASLVKQVLTFGRGIKGERVPVHPKNIGDGIARIVRETFPKSLKFKIQCADDLWTVTGDPTQLEQVLMNLCVNARDAMPGGGTLSLRMENRVFDKNHPAANLEAKPGSYVVISVSDTGMGMAQEVQDRIFEPFFTTKEQGKGTGLGLSTALAIVKSHGGFVNCYSEVGKGSVFKVYLPASPDAANVKPAAANQPRLPRGNNDLVLVVDDEEPIRILVQNILERFGYRVLQAADGAEAVRLYTSHRNEIAAVLTDMSMPVMDGPATIAALRGINPEVKVIGSSGLDMRDGATGAINDGLRHFMSKPYTAETVLNMLHEVLRARPVE